MLQDITRKRKDVELRGKENLEENTDLIEMKKFENSICQARTGA